MRGRWIWAAVGLAGAWFLGDAAASSWTLADYAARPVTLAHPDGRRLPPGTEGLRPLGGEGIAFGHRLRWGTPGGEVVSCDHVLRRMRCDGGWVAERG